jgi:hypothetical protein
MMTKLRQTAAQKVFQARSGELKPSFEQKMYGVPAFF